MPDTMTMTTAERRKFMETNLRTAMLMGEGMESEVYGLLSKLMELTHEYRDGRLYVGSEKPAKWEVRQALHGGPIYCHCPNWIFKARKGDGLCKHAMFAQVMQLDIPRTEDFVKKHRK